MSFYELTEQIINSVDFIFSTVPIPKLDNKKFILVEPIMTEDDLLSVEKQLNKNEENNFMFSGIDYVHFTGCLRGNG